MSTPGGTELTDGEANFVTSTRGFASGFMMKHIGLAAGRFNTKGLGTPPAPGPFL